MKKILLILTVIFLICAKHGYCACGVVGSTFTADGVESADIQECIDEVTWGDGSTLVIPDGTSSTWTQVVISNDDITVAGNGSSGVVLTCPNTGSFTTSGCFYLSPGTDRFEVSGIKFVPVTAVDINDYAIVIGNAYSEGAISCTDIKIHDCIFDGFKWAILGVNAPRGVAYNNSFDDGGFQFYGNDNEWSEIVGWGGSDFFFIEDNAFTSTDANVQHAILNYSGMKVVIRYNTFTSNSTYQFVDTIDAHGYGHGTNHGTRAGEIYSNTFVNADEGGGGEIRAIYLRSGSYRAYDNVFNEIDGAYGFNEIYLDDNRIWADVGYGSSGDCNTFSNDGSDTCPEDEGDPCCDMIGRGQNQGSDPAYFWDNNKCTSSPCLSNLVSVDAVVSSASSAYIVEDEDFYNTEPEGYTPYTYPHPLRGEVVITGTVTADSMTESDIVTGGKTILITLSSDTWVADDGTFAGIRQDIIDGLNSAQSEGTGWNLEVRDKEVVGAVVRTDDDTVTITLSASPLYSITEKETITVTIPASALVTSTIPLVASPTFIISNETPTPSGASYGASFSAAGANKQFSAAGENLE